MKIDGSFINNQAVDDSRATQETVSINTLPTEMIRAILDQLPDPDLASCERVCSLWSTLVLSVMGDRIKAYNALDEQGAWDESVTTIFNFIQKRNAYGATQVANLHSDEIKTKLLLWVKMEVEDIDGAIKMTETFPKNLESQALADIAIRTIRIRNIDKSIEIAKSIPDKDIRMQTFVDVGQGLVENKNFDKAVEVANLISDENVRNDFLSKICRQARIYEGKAKAKEVASLITDEHIRAEVISNVDLRWYR